MGWIYKFGAAIMAYVVMLYAANSITKEKLNISGNMLGTGIATMVAGFLGDAVFVLKFIGAGGNWYDKWTLVYGVMSVICLLVGLAGIVLMAVGILKECTDK